MKVPVTIELTDREEHFVRALCVYGLKPTRAATVCGYAVATARHLLRKEHIRQAIRAVHRNTSELMSRFEKDEASHARKS